MKKIIIISFVFLLSMLSSLAWAQHATDKVRFTQVEVERTDSLVSISFQVETDRRAVTGKSMDLYMPVITDGVYSVSCPTVVVLSKQAAITLERHEWAAGTVLDLEDAKFVENNSRMSYSATVPAQGWMDGADLRLETLWMGCSDTESWLGQPIASMGRMEPQPIPVVVEEEVPSTTGETLARAFNFVLPDSQWNDKDPIYDNDRENALIVYYRVAISRIEPEFMDNRQTLRNLVAAINLLRTSEDSRVKRIVIAGFASPEGTFEFNDRLAWDRAVSIKEYIMNQTGMRDSDISLYNGSEDWRGLRAMVASSSMPERQRILDIIDTYPIKDAAGRKVRLDELKKVNDGVPYRYMYDHYFPRLRNGAFIRVYYEDK